VVPESTYGDPRFQTLLEVICSPEFKEGATALGGYDLKDCGKIVWEQYRDNFATEFIDMAEGGDPSARLVA